ncbi:MAG: amidohydrolase family protein, partial [Bacteroidales bacterium]|nr:amidohydrolase family protein [Bacteroidales bacterium]
MKAKNFLFILAVAVFSNCANESNNKETKSATTNLQQTIYYGGDIITMEGDNPQYVEAVIEREGKIIYAGPKASAVNNFAGKTIEIDLKGKTMLPGFVDPHGHFMSAVLMVTQVNCASPPMGDVTDIPSVIKKLQEFKDSNSIKDGEWIVGWGYDQDLLAEKRHITKMDLDKAFPNNKVLIIHISMHGGVLNSKALEWAELDETSETPEGGVIARIPGTNEPAGLLMEMAYMPVFDKLPQPSEDEMMELMEAAQMQYTSNGYTHAIEGFTHIKDMNILKRAAKEGRFFIDIASLPGFTEMDKWLNNPEYPFGEYNNHLKFQGGKFTLDGSPQGLTAYMVDPFFVMWTSMKRETRSGKILGPDQRIDAYAALQQITTGPAYQFFEENRKGMIKKGMLADFVILDKNPLKLQDVDAMREITVLETIKEGTTVFKKKIVDPIKGYFAKN